MTPGGAWAPREELKALTPKPVRYVINTHWHWDHAHGNQIYGPDVEIIGVARRRPPRPLSAARSRNRSKCSTRSSKARSRLP